MACLDHANLSGMTKTAAQRDLHVEAGIQSLLQVFTQTTHLLFLVTIS